MAIAQKIKNLNFGQFFSLSKVFILNPLYIIPTYKATKKTINISNDSFGKKHHFDNRTNSFRHALWNFLICKHCFKISNSSEKAVLWAKKITDLHEKLSPNEELAKIMDLHNNKIGRELFSINPKGKLDAVPVLKKMMDEAVQIKSLEEIKNAKTTLVFIEKLKSKI